MPTTIDIKSLAIRYIEAAGEKNYSAVWEMLDPDIAFKGAAFQSDGPDDVIATLKRMAPVWERNVIRAAFAEGERACVVYDFVTDTAAGAIPCVKLITFREDRISDVELFFDRVQFAPASQALAQRAAQG